jgi:prepilin-type N-terminal cleavage/methylation domain-containing protein
MKKSAFTLAEVLIVIGIIGVVSAMTIPALMNKCQKVVLAHQAKKEYAMWTQVFKNILADNNTTSLSETELWGKIENSSIDYDVNPTTTNTAFWPELGKYVKFLLLTNEYSKNTTAYYERDEYIKSQGTGYPIFLSDGSMLRQYYFYKTPYRETDDVCSKIKELGGSMCNYIGAIYIDVNGNKGPNVYGRDIFEFYLSDEGILYPVGGKDYALYKNHTPIEKFLILEGFYTNKSGEYTYGEYQRSSWNPYYWKSYDTSKAGAYATGRLMEEGWKMNY